LAWKQDDEGRKHEDTSENVSASGDEEMTGLADPSYISGNFGELN
jgi:hypothetical protein